jgi:hypothetical protein
MKESTLRPLDFRDRGRSSTLIRTAPPSFISAERSRSSPEGVRRRCCVTGMTRTSSSDRRGPSEGTTIMPSSVRQVSPAFGSGSPGPKPANAVSRTVSVPSASTTKVPRTGTCSEECT